MNKVLYSSNSFEWSTPSYLFDYLDSIFHFDIDVCASEFNHKCDLFYDLSTDGLSKDWFGNVWCNPPYGRTICKWIEKGFRELDHCSSIVYLLPARTDTKWFHKYFYCKSNVFVKFIENRLCFNEFGRAPFPSMLCIVFRDNVNI